jgi:leucyl-tRNA synthetase
MKEYDHTKIEKKWQKEWTTKKVYKTEATSNKKKFYVLDMFPYPSGAGLHVGHPRGYIGSDVYARMKRMQGYNVLHPMGYDAFGLPAEQYAIEHKIHPKKAVDINVATFEKQLSIIGLSYDWSRKVNTTDPAYYKWTQWIFLGIYNSWYDTKKDSARPIADLISIFEKSGNKNVSATTDANWNTVFGAHDWKSYSKKEQQDILMKYRLAYEGYALVNWCPKLGTVLANDEIVDDKDGNPVSERGNYPVEKIQMRQWFMRITAYADKLLDGLEGLNWSTHIKEIQKNWIGKSEGLIFTAPVKDTDMTIQTFSTHFEACYADTFVVIAPDHPFLQTLTNGVPNQKEILAKAKDIIQKRDTQNSDKEMEGIFTGRYIVDPLGNGDLPIWVASFALANYGTGIVKCSCHDERDFAFAKKYNIALKPVLFPKDEALAKQVKNFEICYSDMNEGILSMPLEFAGKKGGDVREEIADYLENKGYAKRKTTYKMRDAIFARQRYWGEPIPLTSDKKTGIINALKVKDLPLKLPNVNSYEPTGTGESPLASVKAWVKEGYETNTMPGWAGSSWYFLRYMDPTNTKEFASKKSLAYWKDVDMYVGGQEHATGHLLYSRFWHKFLYDMKYVPTAEPFKTLKNQGLIMATDGRKMSKRWGNVINPDEIVKTYGADTLRVYEMFIGPFDQSVAWSTDSIIGSRRFLEKVWKGALITKEANVKKTDEGLQKVLHKTIKKVSEDIETMNFNTAISSMMMLSNEIEKIKNISIKDYKLYLQVLAPFAPHITEELYATFGDKKSLHTACWPKWDTQKIVDDTVTIAIQVNGKVRTEVTIDASIDENEAKNIALVHPTILPWIEGKEIKRVIYVKGRLINIVV